jgi:hypothetical protein
LLDADRNENPDEDIERGFMRLKNLNLVPVGTLNHGTILIFVRKDQMDSLNFYLNEISNEVYMYLIEKDGGVRNRKDFGKFKFSYNDSLRDIYKRI